MSEPTFADEPDTDNEEEDPVFVLWEGGGIETFNNEDDAREEMMAMGSRGCQGMKFSSLEDAEDALKAMAEHYNKKALE